jgi:hypothetical protein
MAASHWFRESSAHPDWHRRHPGGVYSGAKALHMLQWAAQSVPHGGLAYEEQVLGPFHWLGGGLERNPVVSTG